ncbi:hypothetical protein CDV36_004183 [Fusarium kuroshium]|uniref:Uncharacterized protein n=2 Tax=Fusarium solani species complex TaxID=232080 RepID=A0A3M2SF01_9HYPO|nr:hypothetical protein CDV36_004183 [Fusarium kuroshium]RSL80267.1 hypothetical protein CEP51_006722 [Fusarium floridanum]
MFVGIVFWRWTELDDTVRTCIDLVIELQRTRYLIEQPTSSFFQRHPALDFSTYQDLPTKHFTVSHNNKQYIMGLFWSKGIGGRHFGTSIHVDKNGVRRGPWRFSLGKFSCFRA